MTYKELEDYYAARDDSIHFDLRMNSIQDCLNDFKKYKFYFIYDASCRCKHDKCD